MSHGEELVCSYAACRDAGVKFCYCSKCQTPVAKRNFRVRHNHCDFVLPSSGAAADPSSPEVPISFAGLPKEYLRTLPGGNRSGGGSVVAAKPPTPMSATGTEAQPQENRPTASAHPDPRRRAWDLLLDTRPPPSSDSTALQVWLTEVLTTSSQIRGEAEETKESLSPTSATALATVVQEQDESQEDVEQGESSPSE